MVAGEEAAIFEGLWWMSGLVLALAMSAVVLAWARRRLQGLRPPSRSSFTLEELKRLRDRGDLAPTEFEALRDQVIRGMTCATKPGEPASQDPVLQGKRLL